MIGFIWPYHVEPPSFGFRWYLSHPVFLYSCPLAVRTAPAEFTKYSPNTHQICQLLAQRRAWRTFKFALCPALLATACHGWWAVCASDSRIRGWPSARQPLYHAFLTYHTKAPITREEPLPIWSLDQPSRGAIPSTWGLPIFTCGWQTAPRRCRVQSMLPLPEKPGGEDKMKRLG